MRKKEVLIIALFLILMPIADAFSGSGDGYDVFGITGAGAASGTGDGYDIQFTPTSEPVGAGTGDGYSLVLGMFFAEPAAAPPIIPPSTTGGGSGGGCSDQCDQGQTACDEQAESNYMACEYSVQEGCWQWFSYQCENTYVCEAGACVPGVCQEDWICDDWSECENGMQERDCDDWNKCDTYEKTPNEKRACEEEEEVGVGEELAPIIAPPPVEPEIETPSMISAAAILSWVWIALGALVLIAVLAEVIHGISIKRRMAPPKVPETGLYYIKEKNIMEIDSDLNRINKNLNRLKKR